MGGAILTAGIRSGLLDPKTTFAFDRDKNKEQAFATNFGVLTGDPGDADIVILAVKPQMLEYAFPLKTAPGALLISVLAGVSSEKLRKTSEVLQICRAMPNTPALVGAGMSVLFFTSMVSEENRTFCTELFSACGNAIEIKDEDLMHAVTALSGSGPAYYFRFVELLADAGHALGLPKKMALMLAMNTLIGAAELMNESEEEPESLRKKVTSPGGTTEAALEAFDESGFKNIVKQALIAAEKRSRKLGE